MPATLVDRIRERAERQPDHPALSVDEGSGTSRNIRYGALVERLEDHAKQLAGEGLRPGDRCGLMAPQGAGFVEWALGILAAGGCLVPIAEDHRGQTFQRFAERARLHHVVECDGASGTFRTLPDPGAVDGADDVAFRALRPAYLRFTSGTTNLRKGVILGHDAILARTAAANRALEIGPGDRVLWLLPMAHHFVVSILLYLRYGATILLPGSSLARPVLELARRERATVFYASPHHYRLLAKDESDLRLETVRLAISTADGLPEQVAGAFLKRFGFPVAQALGIIEVGLPVANLDAAAEKPGALGRVLPDYEVWLRGEDGRAVTGRTSPERTGEICIRGPGALDAYMDPWLPAARVLAPDGFRTGDQGWFDDDGLLHLAGRRANRISMAGLKFFGEEVEEVLDAHPAVQESRVFARPHPHLGEIPAAEIVVTPGCATPDRKELTAHCRAALPAYKIPREFRPVETLPRTPTGKLRRDPAPPD